MDKIVFTLCSNNYLAQAKTLGDSIKHHLPDYRFVIGLIDKKNKDIDYKFFDPYEVIPYNELGFECFDEMIERYNIVEFNTAVKPFYFQYFFSRNDKIEKVFYIDPDIEVFSSFKHLEELLDRHNFLLTPHILYPLEKKGAFEQLILNVGIFNLGFLGVRNSEESNKFLKWWSHRMEFDCKIDFVEGLFVDQIWANFLPVLFDGVHILKDPGYNMGYWNFEERILTEDNGSYLVNNKYPLHFFHFSNFNPLKPEKLCRWLNYSFEKRPDLKNIYDGYAQRLLENQYEKFSKVERGLDFKQNHPHFDRIKKIKGQAKRGIDYPKISIITPSYNQGQFLEQTIRSVIEQDYPNLEYIVVDGGSTDNSVEIIKKYEMNIAWWVSERDNGQTHAINKGFSRATGELITWLNSDDYYEPGVLNFIGELYSERRFDFLAGSVNMVNMNGKFLKTRAAKWPRLNQLFYSDDIYIAQPATIFRKELYSLYGPLDESFHYSMDFDFWMKLRFHGIEFTLIDDVITNFRVHELAKTSGGEENFVMELLDKYSSLRYLFNRDVRNMVKLYQKFLGKSKNIDEKTKQKYMRYHYLFDPKPPKHFWMIRNKIYSLLKGAR